MAPSTRRGGGRVQVRRRCGNDAGAAPTAAGAATAVPASAEALSAGGLDAFNEVYSAVLRALLAKWQRENCEYMQFGAVMNALKQKLLRVLRTRPHSIADFTQLMTAAHT